MKQENDLTSGPPSWEAIRRYAARLLGDWDQADDVAQEVFLRLEQHRDTIQMPRAWAYRTARNLVLDQFRKRTITGGADDGLDGIPAEATRFNPALLAEKKETDQMIQAKINELPPRQREVLRLKFQEGLKYAEIADVLDESVSNVGWLIHQAVTELRKELLSSTNKTTQTI